MAPLTDTKPKPLIKVAGQALIDHALGLATDAGLKQHVNAHYHADQMQTHLPKEVTLHVESPDILDTGGGLKAALAKMQGDVVATLNSDAVWLGPNPLKILKSAWRPDMQCLLLLVPLEHTTGYTRDGNFAIGDRKTLTRNSTGQVYTGAQMIRRDVVLSQPQTVFSLNAVWDHLLVRDGLFGVTYSGEWADVGTPEGIGQAEAMLAKTHV